jgi:filamentous hemagglutinin family protein
MNRYRFIHNLCNSVTSAKLKQLAVFICSVAFISVSYANPVLNNVSSGQVNVTQSGNTTTVNQGSQQAIINWNSFNINSGEKTQFIQPNSSSVALNRINPAQGVSQIYGSLSSNGQIILINGAGIHFGPGSMVNVGGLIASTSDITDANFLAHKYLFNIPSAYNGSIVNEGSIIAANYGLVALLGTSVVNTGYIQAELGNIVLGSGNAFTLDFNGDQLINFTVDQAATSKGVDQNGNEINAGVTNSGSLIADGGKVLVSASAAAGVLDNVIDMQGVAQANSVTQQNGEIVLDGGENGTVQVSGTLEASGDTSGSSGGSVQVLGNQIHLTSTAVVNTTGDVGGGQINIGGSEHGQGPLQNANLTEVDSGALLNASAITSGNGGNIVVWGSTATQFGGTILSTGGTQSGNGGNAETSGEYLAVLDSTSVNLSAANGTNGTWLLDPADLTISYNTPTANFNSGNNTYTSNGSSSNVNFSQLSTALNSANITISTSGSGGTGNITFSSTSGPVTPYNYNASNTLTLNADASIIVQNPINNLGSGSLIFNAALTPSTSGQITIQSAITLNGGSLTLNANSSTNSSAIASISALSLAGGTLTISALNSVSQNVQLVSVTAANLVLSSGSWYQENSTLPTLSLSNNFSLGSGSTFIRATTGTGSTSQPYFITDIYGLQGMATVANTSGGNSFKLVNDIDATIAANWTNSNGTGFTPIGTSSAAYNGGVANGNGFAVVNLTINQPNAAGVGLFGWISNAATIQNFGLINANVTGNSAVGALLGGGTVNQNNTLNNDYVAGGTVTGAGTTPYYIGGLAGYATANINSSYSENTIITSTGANYVGGLAGVLVGVSGAYSMAANLTYSGSSIYAPNGNYIGGLIGDTGGGKNQSGNSNGGGGSNATNSYASGLINAPGATNVAGFAAVASTQAIFRESHSRQE